MTRTEQLRLKYEEHRQHEAAFRALPGIEQARRLDARDPIALHILGRCRAVRGRVEAVGFIQ